MTTEQEQKARALLDEVMNSGKAREAAAAPTLNSPQMAPAPASTPARAVNVAGQKAEEEAAREREIARIEAEVLKAKARREGENPILAPAPNTPAPAAAVVTPAPAPVPAIPSAAPTILPQNPNVQMTAKDEVKARQVLNSDRPENRRSDELPPSNPALQSNLSPEQERKARSLLRADFVVIESDNPAPQTTPPPVKPNMPKQTAPANGLQPTQLPPPISAAAPAAPAPVPAPAPAPAPVAQASPVIPVAPAAAPAAPVAHSLPATPLPARIEPSVTSTAAASQPNVQPAPAAAPAVQGTLTPEMEAKARELLNQAAAAAQTSPAAPVSSPAVVTVPEAAPVVQPDSNLTGVIGSTTPAPATSRFNPDQEARARQLLRRSLRDTKTDTVVTPPAVAAAPTPALAPVPAPAPVPAVAPTPATPVVVAPSPAPVAVVQTPAPAPTPVPVPEPATPASAQKLEPVVVNTGAPSGSIGNMSPDHEAKAREMLKRTTGRVTYTPSPVSSSPAVSAAPAPAPAPVTTQAPVITPTPPAVVVTPPPATAINPPPALTPATGQITAEQEAKARELLLQLSGQKPPATTVTPPPAVATIPPVAAPTTAAAGTMTGEDEARARALLTDVSAKVFTNQPARTVVDPKAAAEEAKLRRRAEEQARKEMERMQKEAQVRAQDEARKKAEAEAIARKEAEQATAAIRAREREQLRKNGATQNQADPALMAKTRTVEPAPAAVPTPAVTPQPAANVPAPATPALRPEDDPSVPLAKRQRLKQLLEDYIKDKITPSEYHTQRAKIIAQPN